MAANAGKQETAAPAAPESEEEAPKTPKRKLPLKLILIAAGGVLGIGGAGAAAFFFLHDKGDEQQHAAAPSKPVAFLDVPDVLVNLSNAGNEKTQYLKVKIVLELPDQAMTPQVQSLLPRVLDAFQTYLRELRPSDLEGSAGLYRLREELTRRVNLALAPSHINAVLFKEIVVQ